MAGVIRRGVILVGSIGDPDKIRSMSRCVGETDLISPHVALVSYARHHKAGLG